MKLSARQTVEDICYQEYRKEPKIDGPFEDSPSIQDFNKVLVILAKWKNSGLGEAGCRHYMDSVFDSIDWSK